MVLGLNGAPAPQSHLCLCHDTMWLPHIVVCERAPSYDTACDGGADERGSQLERACVPRPSCSLTDGAGQGSRVQPLPRSIPTGFLGWCLSLSFRSPSVKLPPHIKAQNEGSLSSHVRHASRSSARSGSWAVAPPVSQRLGVLVVGPGHLVCAWIPVSLWVRP